MDEKRRLQIHSYFQTFFGIIREFLEKERQYEPYVPDMFKFPYLFLMFECLDGYVVAAYPSGTADNFIAIDRDESVEKVAQALPNLVLGTEAHVVLDMQGFGGDGMIEAILDRVETDKGPLPTAGWKFLYFATKSFVWPVDEARKNAFEFVDIFKARAAVYQPSKSGFITHYDRIALWKQTTDRLYDILTQYYAIVSEQNYRERIIHQFLNANQNILAPQRTRVFYEYLLQENGLVSYKADFILELPPERCILIELENPKHRIFTTGGDFTREVNHAEKQVQDWMLWIREHLDLVRQDLPGAITPEGLIIIGRNADLTDKQHNQIRIRNEKHNIRLITYDDLAEEFKNYITNLLES